MEITQLAAYLANQRFCLQRNFKLKRAKILVNRAFGRQMFVVTNESADRLAKVFKVTDVIVP